MTQIMHQTVQKIIGNNNNKKKDNKNPKFKTIWLYILLYKFSRFFNLVKFYCQLSAPNTFTEVPFMFSPTHVQRKCWAFMHTANILRLSILYFTPTCNCSLLNTPKFLLFGTWRWCILYLHGPQLIYSI